MSVNTEISSRMIDLSKFAVLHSKSTLKDALDAMTKHRLGIACMVDDQNILLGVLTDGDLRRLLLTKQAPLPALLISPALEFGHTNPITITLDNTLDQVKTLMASKEVWDLPVLDKNGVLIGLIHRHSLS